MSPKAYEAKDGRFVHELSGVVTGLLAGDRLNVRAAADAGSAVLARLHAATAVTVQGEEIDGGTKWLLINAGNKSGWVKASYIKLTDADCK